MSSDLPSQPSRRNALKCLAYGGVGTVFVLAGGVLTPMDLALAASAKDKSAMSGVPLFLQISDSHIGFNKEANPDVAGTFKQTIDYVNAMPAKPALAIHTGDITHLSKPEEFDLAAQLLSGLSITELHTVPGEHDVTDGPQGEYFKRFGKPSDNRGYYSFDHEGVHFVALVNVMHFKPNGLGNLGEDQLAWLENDLKGRTSSTPIVVFTHMPMWTIYEPWGWGTGDAGQAMDYLKRFGSVTVLNGHIHQTLQKVEGNVTFYSAMSTAFPQPAPGSAPAAGPMKVPAEQLRRVLGIRNVNFVAGSHHLAVTESDLN